MELMAKVDPFRLVLPVVLTVINLGIGGKLMEFLDNRRNRGERKGRVRADK